MMIKRIILAVFIVLTTLCVEAQPAIKEIHKDAGVWILKIDTDELNGKIKPYVSDELVTAGELYASDKYEMVVNAGFFDLNTGKSVSYITLDGKQAGSLTDNHELLLNLADDNRLEKVMNRAELRILSKKGTKKLFYDIANHFDKVEKDYKIVHAIQGGPMLLSFMDLEAEGFVTYKDERAVKTSADILKRRARTTIGLKDEDLYIVIFDNNKKVDANEMHDYLKKKLKLDKAMAFDGGTSTSLNFETREIKCTSDAQRAVKSFIVVEK